MQRILQGQMPGPLTQEGVLQAETLRDKLRDVYFHEIYTSDLLRAEVTTRIISEPHGGRYVLEPLLRERDFGIHTGGPYIKIARALDPSAETMEDLAQRAADFLTKMVCNHETSAAQDVHILAVSHGLFLRVLQAVYHQCPVREIEKMENAEVRTLTLCQDMHFDISPLEETGGTAN